MALEVEVALRRDLAEERTLDATEFVVAEVEEVWRRDLVEEHALGVVRLEVLEADEALRRDLVFAGRLEIVPFVAVVELALRRDLANAREVTAVEPVVGLQSLLIFTPRFRILLALPLTIGKTYEISTA